MKSSQCRRKDDNRGSSGVARPRREVRWRRGLRPARLGQIGRSRIRLLLFRLQKSRRTKSESTKACSHGNAVQGAPNVVYTHFKCFFHQKFIIFHLCEEFSIEYLGDFLFFCAYFFFFSRRGFHFFSHPFFLHFFARDVSKRREKKHMPGSLN